MQCRAVEATLGDVGPAVLWADSLAAEANLDDNVRYAIQLCLEEALANLVMHGEPADGSKDISVQFEAGAARAKVTVIDRCLPFDLVARGPLPAAARKDGIGGQGVRLIHKFASRLAYRSVGGRNILEMTFEPRA